MGSSVLTVLHYCQFEEVERQSIKMPKQLIKIEMERDSLQQKWGITIQGGADLSLTAKIASVKRFSPADRAGLEKMDYVWTVNGKEVFNMTQPQITNEIVNSKLKMVLQVEEEHLSCQALMRFGLKLARRDWAREARGWEW